jgi:hypothetical protein
MKQMEPYVELLVDFSELLNYIGGSNYAFILKRSRLYFHSELKGKKIIENDGNSIRLETTHY